LYLATHQHDLLDSRALETELLSRYAQGDELYEVRRHLPSPPGIKEQQQYLVIKLAQPSAKISSLEKLNFVNMAVHSAA
jgi:hypothetical protein